MKDPNQIVAVKCEGSFTEWYSPFFKEPYNDNEEYRDYYNDKIINIQPVIGPSLGETEEEFLSDDLDCLSDRMMVDCGDEWDVAKNAFENAVEEALTCGKEVVLDEKEYGRIVITPYRRCEMPKPNEEHLKVYGPYADLMRQRVAEI